MNVVNIGIFGRRNVGKSSIVNLLTGQEFSIVSAVPGTTTDPVRKRMEMPGIGACCFIDTAGIDDEGPLGELRVQKTLEIVAQIDLALLVLSDNLFGKEERDFLSAFQRFSVPVVVLHNQSDRVRLEPEVAEELLRECRTDVLEFSTRLPEEESREAVQSLTALMEKALSASSWKEQALFDGIVQAGQSVLLVCPIDGEAPAGRLILPQVMAIRNLLDLNAVAHVIQPVSLRKFFPDGQNPMHIDLVVVDSQLFQEVGAVVPEGVALTSFSMLLARSKGCFDHYIAGTPAIDALQDGDRVLILESCTHNATCEDIGRVKIPALFRKYTRKNLSFEVVAGLDRIVRPMEEYALVVQCGGCMVTGRQLHSRLLPALERKVPVTNYGMAISYMNGIYIRAIKPLTR